jgi:hypothetical protein
MAGQLNKIHAAQWQKKSQGKITANNWQYAAQQFSNRSPRCGDHGNATVSVTRPPQN